MAETGRKLEVRFGAFSCSVEGYDDPVEQMREVLLLMQGMIRETPALADHGPGFGDAEVALIEDALDRRAERHAGAAGIVVIRGPESGRKTGRDGDADAEDAVTTGDIPLAAGRPADAAPDPQAETGPPDRPDVAPGGDAVAADHETGRDRPAPAPGIVAVPAADGATDGEMTAGETGLAVPGDGSTDDGGTRDGTDGGMDSRQPTDGGDTDGGETDGGDTSSGEPERPLGDETGIAPAAAAIFSSPAAAVAEAAFSVNLAGTDDAERDAQTAPAGDEAVNALAGSDDKAAETRPQPDAEQQSDGGEHTDAPDQPARGERPDAAGRPDASEEPDAVGQTGDAGQTGADGQDTAEDPVAAEQPDGGSPAPAPPDEEANHLWTSPAPGAPTAAPDQRPDGTNAAAGDAGGGAPVTPPSHDDAAHGGEAAAVAAVNASDHQKAPREAAAPDTAQHADAADAATAATSQPDPDARDELPGVSDAPQDSATAEPEPSGKPAGDPHAGDLRTAGSDTQASVKGASASATPGEAAPGEAADRADSADADRPGVVPGGDEPANAARSPEVAADAAPAGTDRPATAPEATPGAEAHTGAPAVPAAVVNIFAPPPDAATASAVAAPAVNIFAPPVEAAPAAAAQHGSGGTPGPAAAAPSAGAVGQAAAGQRHETGEATGSDPTGSRAADPANAEHTQATARPAPPDRRPAGADGSVNIFASVQPAAAQPAAVLRHEAKSSAADREQAADQNETGAGGADPDSPNPGSAAPQNRDATDAEGTDAEGAGAVGFDAEGADADGADADGADVDGIATELMTASTRAAATNLPVRLRASRARPRSAVASRRCWPASAAAARPSPSPGRAPVGPSHRRAAATPPPAAIPARPTSPLAPARPPSRTCWPSPPPG